MSNGNAPNIVDFLTFRTMITPVIIQVLFWIGVIVSVISGLVMIIAGIAGGDGEGVLAVLFGLFYLVLGPVITRIYCEILILFFRMNETLTEIRINTSPRV